MVTGAAVTASAGEAPGAPVATRPTPAIARATVPASSFLYTGDDIVIGRGLFLDSWTNASAAGRVTSHSEEAGVF
jgi:hypothetical protein